MGNIICACCAGCCQHWFEVKVAEEIAEIKAAAKLECPGKAKNPLGCGVLTSALLCTAALVLLVVSLATVGGLSRCKARCDLSCWPSARNPGRNICGDDGEACYRKCKPQLSEKVQMQMDQCLTKVCTPKCTGEPDEDQCIAKCNTECAAIAGCTDEMKAQDKCIEESTCAAISDEALTKVYTCYQMSECDAKGRVSGISFRVALLLPFIAVLVFGVYKEALTRFKWPYDYSCHCIFGRTFWAMGVITAWAAVLYLLIFLPHDNDFIRWVILPFALTTGGLASWGACVLLTCSRYCLQNVPDKLGPLVQEEAEPLRSPA